MGSNKCPTISIKFLRVRNRFLDPLVRTLTVDWNCLNEVV